MDTDPMDVYEVYMHIVSKPYTANIMLMYTNNMLILNV